MHNEIADKRDILKSHYECGSSNAHEVFHVTFDNSYRCFIFYVNNDMEKESNFRVYGWMIHKLHLKGNELLCYALIYRECEEMGSCPMTFKEISNQTGMSYPTVGTVIKSLCKKGYINKEQYVYGNFPYNSYTINKKEDGTL